MICSNCNQPMDPVELHDVPADNIKDFVDVPGNKLDDNWYWCSNCDSYEQFKTTEKSSPEIERVLQTLSSFVSDW